MSGLGAITLNHALVVFDGTDQSIQIVDAALTLFPCLHHATLLLVANEGNKEGDLLGEQLSQVASRHAPVFLDMQATTIPAAASMVTNIMDLAGQLATDFLVIAIPQHIQQHLAQSRHQAVTLGEALALASTRPVVMLPSVESAGAALAPVRRIVVPLDTSAISRQAIPVAAEIARSLDVPIELITVIDPVHALPPAYAYLPDEDGDRRDVIVSLQGEANYVLDRCEHALGGHGIPAKGRLLYGPVGKSLLSAVEPGDIIVMTTHGQGNAARSRFGSTTLQVVQAAEVPVVVVYAPGDLLQTDSGLVAWDIPVRSPRVEPVRS